MPEMRWYIVGLVVIDVDSEKDLSNRILDGLSALRLDIGPVVFHNLERRAITIEILVEADDFGSALSDRWPLFEHAVRSIGIDPRGEQVDRVTIDRVEDFTEASLRVWLERKRLARRGRQ